MVLVTGFFEWRFFGSDVTRCKTKTSFSIFQDHTTKRTRHSELSTSKMKLSLLIAAVAALCVEADTTDHKYKKEEHIELWVNKVRSKSIVRSFCNDPCSVPQPICSVIELRTTILQ